MDGYTAIVGFDLAWAGQTGWALLLLDRDGYYFYETGVIRAKRKTKTEKDKALRALNLVDGIRAVLSRDEVVVAARVVICYENPLKWLLAASRQHRRRRPVTRNSLMAGAFCVTCFHVAVAMYMRELEPGEDELEIVAVDTQSARSKFGVGDLTKQDETLIDYFEAMPGFADRKKACVGAAVLLRLFQEDRLGEPGVAHGLDMDHQADALLMCFVVGDEEKLRLMEDFLDKNG